MKFPDFSRSKKFPDFSRFSRSVDTLIILLNVAVNIVVDKSLAGVNHALTSKNKNLAVFLDFPCWFGRGAAQ